MLELLQKAGPLIYPLGLCSLLAATITVERMISLRRSRVLPREIIEVDPNIPVQPNDYVVVQTTDDRAFIKLLRRRTQRAVILEQFNPPKELRFAPEEVAAMHLIVGAHRVYR